MDLNGGSQDARWPCRLRPSAPSVVDTTPAEHRTRILYITKLPIADVRANLSKLVDEAMRTHQRVEVTKNGRRAAVLMSADDYDL